MGPRVTKYAMTAASVTGQPSRRGRPALVAIKPVTQFQSRQVFIGVNGYRDAGKASNYALNGNSVADDNSNHGSP
jgi:hypothetical protein